MRFVIYGAGDRGKRLFSYIKSERVAAFIDRSPEKQGTMYCEKPVISLEDYQEKYADLFIIQSINVDESVAETLNQSGICQHSELSRLPGEFAGWGTFDYRIAFWNHFENKKMVYLYGINALTLLAAEYCEDRRIPAFLIPGPDDSDRAEWVRKYTNLSMTELTQVDDKAEIYVGEERYANSVQTSNTVQLYDFKPFYNGIYDNNRIKNLYNFKRGEKCFIVATGPSLRMEDLIILNNNNVFTFGLNSIIKIQDQWLPNAYVCMDTAFLTKNADVLDEYPVPYKFFSDVNIEFPWNNKEGTYRLHCVSNDYHMMPAFEPDLSLQVSFGVTVTFVALQVAVYMGFSEIYLLGVDCNYLKGSQDNYFIKSGEVDKKDHHIDGMILNYQSAKNYADTHGIKIYNATRGGALEVFKRVDFDSLFE